MLGKRIGALLMASVRDARELAQRIVGGGGIGAEPKLSFEDVPLHEGLKAGRDFVTFYHDGTYSADVIRRRLGIE
jgi:hypothetical protein